RMRRERCKLMQQPNAVLVRFAHADDPAATQGDAGPAHVLECSQAVVVIPSRDDLAVKFSRRVEILILRLQSPIAHTLALRFIEQAERKANLQGEPGNGPYYFQDGFELWPVIDLAPRGAHTEACDPLPPCLSSCCQNMIDRKQVLPLHACLVVSALRAVGAIL